MFEGKEMKHNTDLKKIDRMTNTNAIWTKISVSPTRKIPIMFLPQSIHQSFLWQLGKVSFDLVLMHR